MNARLSRTGAAGHGASRYGAGRYGAAALLAVLCMLACDPPAGADVPDNRGPKLNPEDPVSPEYGRTLEERDRQRRERAREAGESYVTTFQGTGRTPGRNEGIVPAREPGDGRAQWRASAPGPESPATRPVPVYEWAGAGAARPAGTGEGLAAMIGVLLESWTRPPEIARLRYMASPERGAGERDGTDPAARGAAPAPHRARLPSIEAGAGFYARTLYSVDSDYPGPVVLELLQPPLAGAVMHGGFERVRERLVLRLTSLTRHGRTFPVDAWAVDPACACYGIEGEVDRHFLSRVVLPAAARFAEGFLNAAAMPARTVTMQDGAVLHERGESGEREALQAGAGEAARTLGDILAADAPREATVRIPRDTSLVVTFARAPEPGARGTADAGD